MMPVRMSSILGSLVLAVAGTAASGLVATGVAPSALAAASQATIPADQAAGAIAATLAQASRTGMTFTSRGGRTFQRSADSTVVAELEEGKLRFLTLFRGSRSFPLAPLEWVSPKEQIAIPRQLSAAYGIGKNPWANVLGETEEPDLLNPFIGITEIPTAEVVVDAQGRATKVLIDGSTEVEIVNWTAPLAVAPSGDRILDADKSGTVQNLEVSADWFYDAVYEFTRRVSGDPRYRSAPLKVLRQGVKVFGWPAVNTSRGVTITLTDGLGATWKAEVVAEPKVARVTSYRLLAHPPIMNADIANARLRLGILALTTAESMACPRDCFVYDRAAPLVFDKALPRLIEATRSDQVTGQTAGPDYPGSADEEISIGIEGTAADFVMRSSFEEAGYCVSVSMRGPGSPVMPTSFQAGPGAVGPYGTCVP